MEVYFGTVVRAAPVSEGGSLCRLDWTRKTVTAEVPIAPTEPALDHDPNARGNVRGCRGIQVVGDTVVAADYHSLNLFDRDLKFRRRVSHGLMVGLHEIQAVDDSVWVTSTTLDAALRYRLADGFMEAEFWPREVPELQQAVDTGPLPVDKTADNRAAFLDSESFRGPGHLHLNAVCEFRGEVYALFHSKAAVANLSRGEVVIRDPHLKHAHNLLIDEPGIVTINDTRRTVVRQFDLESGAAIRAIDLRRTPGVKPLLLRSAWRALREMGPAFFSSRRKATARPLYLRGLAMNADSIFAGFSPATIVQIDRRTGAWVDSYFHSDDARVCIHGLAI